MPSAQADIQQVRQQDNKICKRLDETSQFYASVFSHYPQFEYISNISKPNGLSPTASFIANSSCLHLPVEVEIVLPQLLNSKTKALVNVSIDPGNTPEKHIAAIERLVRINTHLIDGNLAKHGEYETGGDDHCPYFSYSVHLRSGEDLEKVLGNLSPKALNEIQ